MNVEVLVCKGCKRLFHSVNGMVLCTECRQAAEDEFKMVKEYVRTHVDQGVKEVSEACNVSPQKILNWVREDRLYFADGLKVMLPCLACGTNISSGKYCKKCQQLITEGLNPVTARVAEMKKSVGKKSTGKSEYISIKK